jgi:hypothetical protein
LRTGRNIPYEMALPRAAKKNPVSVMDSVDALDLLDESLKLLRDGKPAEPAFLDRVREQRLRHRRALRSIIGHESL